MYAREPCRKDPPGSFPPRRDRQREADRPWRNAVRERLAGHGEDDDSEVCGKGFRELQCCAQRRSASATPRSAVSLHEPVSPTRHQRSPGRTAAGNSYRYVHIGETVRLLRGLPRATLSSLGFLRGLPPWTPPWLGRSGVRARLFSFLALGSPHIGDSTISPPRRGGGIPQRGPAES